MNGKFVLCLAVVMIGQTMSSSVFDGEELKKVGEQLSLSALSIGNHLKELAGISDNSDAQKTLDKYKALFTKGVSDLEGEFAKLRELVYKNTDVKLTKKLDEFEKEIKKQSAEAKQLFEEKIGKPVNEKYKDDVKKLADSVLKSTKDIEATINKAIDGVKKQ